jgi:hypothetical protein
VAPGEAKPPVAVFMPTDDELDLLWQAEAKFCFAMPSSTGMTGTHPVTKRVPPLLAVGDGGPDLPTITAKVRAEFAAELKADHVQEVIVPPENPVSPPWAPVNQAQMVAWLTQMFGEPPAAYHESYFAYKWAPLPAYDKIASGKF